MSKVLNRALKILGEKRVINGITIQVLEYDASNNVRRATGLTAPTGAGYAKGALFVKTNAASGTKGLYENQGTTSAASFNLIGEVSGLDIPNSAVSIEHLDSGIAPSHVVKFAGTVTWASSGTGKAFTIAGVLATDIVVASFLVNPTQAAYITKVVPTTDTITFTLSAANTSNDAQISYVVLRAAV